MNTDWILLTTSISIIVGLLAIIKFLFDLKKELSDFKTETKVEIVKMQSQMQQFENRQIGFEKRFDKYDGVHTDIEVKLAEVQKQQAQLKEQVVENQNQTNAKLLQIEADNKQFIKELFQSVENLVKGPPVL